MSILKKATVAMFHRHFVVPVIDDMRLKRGNLSEFCPDCRHLLLNVGERRLGELLESSADTPKCSFVKARTFCYLSSKLAPVSFIFNFFGMRPFHLAPTRY